MRRVGLILAAISLSLSLLPAAVSAGSTTTGHALPARQPTQAELARAQRPRSVPSRDSRLYAQMKSQAAGRGDQRTVSPFIAGPAVPTIGANWEGVFNTNVTPPDPTGAIGLNSYIELVNISYGIFDRAGGAINTGSLATLTGVSGFLTDPQILWDTHDQRFYYVVLNASNNTLAWGFSKNSNPLSAADFCKYTANFGYGSNLPDYPKLGNTQRFLLIGVNVFAGGQSYIGSDVDVIFKGNVGPNPITTCPAQSSFGLNKFSTLRNQDGTLAFTPVPAINADNTETALNPFGFVVATPLPGPSSTYITIYGLSNTGIGLTLSPPHSLSVPAYSVPPNAPQCQTTARLDTLDGRLEKAVLAADPLHGVTQAIWTAHAVAGGAGSQERWYEIKPAPLATPTLVQSGVATDSSLYVFNGAISPDRTATPSMSAHGSNMVLGFNTSNASTCSAIQMVSKVGNNPQSGFVLVKQSPGRNFDFFCGQFGFCRWGDYSSATPDPAASLVAPTGKVWLSNMWNVASVDNSDVDNRTFNWEATP
jgi:hypothetical protein